MRTWISGAVPVHVHFATLSRKCPNLGPGPDRKHAIAKRILLAVGILPTEVGPATLHRCVLIFVTG